MSDILLPTEFYQKSAPDLAVSLLGCHLRHRIDGQWVGGIISETEAYTADDEASHSFRGRTARNQAMFEKAGTLYVYRIYGMHFCLNISSGEAGIGEAVLLRGIIPLWGIETMRKRRQWPEPKTLRNLCNGPGKLAQALAINLAHNGLWPDAESPIQILPAHRTFAYTTGPRIGISKNVSCPWRFCLEELPGP